MNETDKGIVTTFRLRPGMIADLSAEAERLQISRNELVQKIVRDWFRTIRTPPGEQPPIAYAPKGIAVEWLTRLIRLQFRDLSGRAIQILCDPRQSSQLGVEILSLAASQGSRPAGEPLQPQALRPEADQGSHQVVLECDLGTGSPFRLAMPPEAARRTADMMRAAADALEKPQGFRQ